MAHEIHDLDMVLTDDGKAWHGLDTDMGGTFSVDEAFRRIGLDTWEPVKVPLYIEAPVAGADGDFDSELFEVPNSNAVVCSDRPDHVLGTVSDRHQLVTNEEHRDFASAFDLDCSTAGTLKDRRIVWYLLQTGDMAVAGDDFRNYVLVSNNHDGSGAFRVLATHVKVVCNNTFTWAVNGAQYSWALRHTDSIAGKLSAAKDAIAFTYTNTSAFTAEIEMLDTIPFATPSMERVAGFIYPDDETLADHAREARSERRGLVTRAFLDNDHFGTAWGAVDALSTHDLWGRDVRGDRGKNQLIRALNGDISRNLSAARELVLSVA